MERKKLTLPEIFTDLILLLFFTADLIARFFSPLIHLFVVLADLGRLALGRRVRVRDLRLGPTGVLRTF